MNRRDFSKTLLMGGSGLLLAGRSVSAAPQPLKLAVVSRTIEVNGRAATVFGLTGPDDRPGLTLAASETVEVDLEYVGFKIPNKFVVGYGLDYRQEYRNLPYLAALDQGDEQEQESA